MENYDKEPTIIKKTKIEEMFKEIKEHEIKKCEITSSKFHHLFVIKKRGKIIKDDSKIK